MRSLWPLAVRLETGATHHRSCRCRVERTCCTRQRSPRQMKLVGGLSGPCST
jgi:hypothetical protein